MRLTAYRMIALMALTLSVSSCERIMQNMYDQPRDKAYSANPFFADGASSRDPLPGTVPYSRGSDADSSSGREGYQRISAEDAADAAQEMPYPMSEELMVHGKQRYDIYCLPCHSPVGDGDGRIVRRGFPAPPSYHIDRLRQAPDRHFYDVISDGYGVMHAYGDRIDPSDRWAIVAFIRALQLSQHAPVDELPADIRETVLLRLEAP